MGLCKGVRMATGKLPGGPQVSDSQPTSPPASNEWSRILLLPHSLSQAASVALLVHSGNVPRCHLSVSSPGLSCLTASPPSTLKPWLSAHPPMPSITGRTCPNISADIKALYGLLPPHLLPVHLHFLTQLMLLRSQRKPSLQPVCHMLKAESNDMLPSHPVPAVPLAPRTPPSTITV